VLPALCNHHYCATIIIAQPSLLCNHHYCATIIIAQPSLLCNHHYCATIIIVQPSLLHWEDVMARCGTSGGNSRAVALHGLLHFDDR
jgi:hypothetical protein